MSGILDRMLQSQQFTPATVEGYIALQLAKRLGDEAAVRKYVHYLSQYKTERVLHHFRKARHESNPAQAFHSSLKPSDA